MWAFTTTWPIVWLPAELKWACALFLSPEVNEASWDAQLMAQAEQTGLLEVTKDISAIKKADFVYTDTWVDMELSFSGIRSRKAAPANDDALSAATGNSFFSTNNNARHAYTPRTRNSSRSGVFATIAHFRSGRESPTRREKPDATLAKQLNAADVLLQTA